MSAIKPACYLLFLKICSPPDTYSSSSMNNEKYFLQIAMNAPFPIQAKALSMPKGETKDV